MDRKSRQDAFIRVCQDSGFQLETDRAAHLAGSVVGCSALEIWLAMPSMSVMDEIAAGTHPAAAIRSMGEKGE